MVSEQVNYILKGYLDLVYIIIFSPDGSKLASGLNNKIV